MTSVAGPSSLHTALLYGSVEELAAAVVPFLAEGLAAGEPAVLACREAHNALLTEALGHDDIFSLHRELIYVRTAHAIATYRRIVRRHLVAGARRVRLVGEVPVDHRPQEWVEWHRYEAIFNVALAPLPLLSVCAYDNREIPESIREGVEETHPALLTPGGHRPNDRYVDPVSVLRRTTSTRVDRVEDTPPGLQLADLADVTRLPELRARLRAALDGQSGPEQSGSDFAAAVGEILLNAFRHGRPPVDVRLWATPTQLVCTVTDHGDGFDDPLAGYHPPANGSARTGAGLWLVRQTCDRLEAVRTPAGFAVRLTTFLPGPDTPPTLASRRGLAEPVTVRVDRARADAKELARRLEERC
jgi:anti-sigma regulatory factor (Ser/Thr protein kinase)